MKTGNKSPATKYGWVCVAVLLMVLGVQSPTWAQVASGTIVGTVTDQTGAVVPDATVTIKDQLRGFERTVTTNASGDYRIEQLLSGTSYMITVTKGGFQKFEQTNIPLLIQETKRLDVKLEVGQTTQTVTVTGKAPVVSSETVTMGENIDRVRLDKWVNTSVNTFTAAYLIAHYSIEAIDAEQGIQKIGGNLQIRFLIDGQPTDGYYNNFSFQGIEEAKIVDSMAPAEYATPATVQIVSKGGTNAFHAGATMDFSSSALNAMGPLNQARGKSRTNYSMGFNGSGPFVIPKVYNGKDRTFWFADYERAKSSMGIGYTPITNVPTLSMRAGDFSKLKDSSGNVIPIYDPRTGQQFPGNIIPANRFNIVAINMMNSPWMPVPNQTDSTTNHDPEVPYRNWHGDPNQSYSQGGSNIYNFRIDQKITDRDNVNFSFSHWYYYSSLDMVAGPPEPLIQGIVWGSTTYSQYSPSLGWTHVLSPRIVNEFRGGFNRLHIPGRTDRPGGQEVLQQLGIQGIDPGLTWKTVPWITISGLVGTETWISDMDFIDNRWNVIDNITMVFGKHSMKAGWNFLRLQQNSKGVGYWYEGFPYGKYYFDNKFTNNPLTGAGGNSFASFLLGLPNWVSRLTPRSQVAARGYSSGVYFQDDWKFSPRLTFNLGMRWELEGVPYDRNNLYYSWDPRDGALVFPNQFALDHVSPAFNTAIPLKLASAAGFPERLRSQVWGNFLPRIGVAFRPFNTATTVLRAGYGIYNSGYYGNASRGAATSGVNTGGPFALTETFNSDYGAPGSDPTITMPDPWPSGPGAAAGSYGVSGPQPNTHQGKVFQFNLAGEQEFAGTSFSLAYEGHRALSLGWGRDLNRMVPSTTPYVTSGCGQPGALPRADCRRNYYGFTSANIGYSGSSDYYDSMVFKVTRPMSHGLWLQAGWIWANTRGDLGSPTPYNRHIGWGRNPDFPKNRLVINWVYDVPFGKGRYFNVDTGNKWGNGFFDHVFGGWAVSGNLGFLGGTPFTVTYSGTDPSGTGVSGGNPDRIASGKCDPAPCASGLWFDPSAFTTLSANIGRFGNSGYNILQGPAFIRNTMSVYKEFPIWETFKARIQVAMSDPFNMHGMRVRSWNISDTGAGKLDPGRAGGTYGGNAIYARGISLNARLSF